MAEILLQVVHFGGFEARISADGFGSRYSALVAPRVCHETATKMEMVE